MIPEKMLEVMKHDGVVAIATLGQDGPHMVNTWNSYIKITNDERLLIPAGYMQVTEANIATNNNVLMTLGSSKVAGKNGPGTGFLIKGTAAFMTAGPDFDAIKAKFSWARAALAITILSATQTL
jgi:predicted pyridoxine 5'-phosphate oxidase superfamily flavin-nucleotide-binding protein